MSRPAEVAAHVRRYLVVFALDRQGRKQDLVVQIAEIAVLRKRPFWSATGLRP